ncbi:MAG: FecR family protein [Rhodanobacter sp.]
MNPPQSSTSPLPAADQAAAGKQARAWAIKLKTGQPTTEDVAAFRRWRAQSALHAQAWAQASQDWKTLGAMAQVFEERHPQRMATPRQQTTRRFFLGAAASAFGTLAVVGVIRPPAGLWPSWSELGADYRTATGEQRDIQLAHRVQVSLNTQTSISLLHTGGTPRIALIAGEAAVSARHSPCEVLAEDARIVMTHGAVDVRRLATGQVRLRCTEGAAQLHHPSRTVALAARQQILYSRGQLGELGAITPDDAGWRQGVVVFDDLRLVDAIAEINRYRSGRVVLLNDALANRRFSANFKIDALNDAIELLRVVHNVNVRRVGDFVFLS